MILPLIVIIFFFFNDTATTEIYTLSLHDALPICPSRCCTGMDCRGAGWCPCSTRSVRPCSGSSRRSACSSDRKSTRLNSSHLVISYAVFCLKKKKKTLKPKLLELFTFNTCYVLPP